MTCTCFRVLCCAVLWLCLKMLCTTFVNGSACASCLTSTRGNAWYEDTDYRDLMPLEVSLTSSQLPVRTTAHCATLCQIEEWCNSFFYNDVTKTCVLRWMVYVSRDAAIQAQGWRYFRLDSAACARMNSVSHKYYVIDRDSLTCYRVVTSPQMDWLHTRAACKYQNDTLTVLEPVEKARFVQDFMNANKAAFQGSDTYFIGGSRPLAKWSSPWPHTGPDFHWLNGKPVNMTATAPFWFTDRPNNLGGDDNVMSLKTGEHFLWDDNNAGTKGGYVCERPMLLLP